MATAKKVYSDKDFKKVASILNALFQQDTTANVATNLTVQAQFEYDNQKLRLQIFDGGAVRGVLQTNDISTDGTFSAPSNSTVPSTQAVVTYVGSLIQSGIRIRGSYTSTGTPMSYPTASAASAVNATQVGNGSGAGPSIKAGDSWYVAAGATDVLIGPGTVKVSGGDLIIALADTAGDVDASWIVLERNDQLATTAIAGIVQLATQAETEARTVATKVVVPADLINYAQRFVGTITGDSATSAWTATHNFNTKNVIVQVVETVSPFSEVEVEIERTSVNVVTVNFAVAVPTGTNYSIIVLG